MFLNNFMSFCFAFYVTYMLTIYFLPPTANILESFETHQPLVLPDGGYQFQLGREVLDTSLVAELDRIKEFISSSQLKEVTATDKV